MVAARGLGAGCADTRCSSTSGPRGAVRAETRCPRSSHDITSLHPAGLEVVRVNLTDDEKKKDIQRFVDELRLPFPVLLDAKGKVRRRYGLLGRAHDGFCGYGGGRGRNPRRTNDP